MKTTEKGLIVYIIIAAVVLFCLLYFLMTHRAWSFTARALHLEKHPLLRSTIHHQKVAAKGSSGKNNQQQQQAPAEDQVELLPPFRLEYPEHDKKLPWLPGFRNASSGTEIVVFDDGTSRNIRWKVFSAQSPRALIIENTITPAEADEIIGAASPSFEKSKVIADNNGNNMLSSIRTSSGMFLVSDEHKRLAANIRMRTVIRAIAGVPEDGWVEATQVLKYRPNERYVPHGDFYSQGDVANLARGGQRILTGLTWLNKVNKGGETSFPVANLKVKPKAYATIIFYDCDENMFPDSSSIHGGDPPGPGSTKYVAVNWVHPRTFF